MRQTRQFRAALLCGIAGAALILTPQTARAATLASYEFEATLNSSDTDATSTASRLAYDADGILISVAPDVGNPGSALRYFTRSTTIGDARLREPYLSATLTPAPGYALNLDTFGTDLAAISTSTNNYTAQLAVFSSLDNFTNPVHFNFATDPTGTQTPLAPGPYSSVASPGMSFDPAIYHNVTTPVEFRFYLFGNAIEIALLDNIRITGTTIVVPEPLGLGGALLLLAARRHRRVAR